MATKFSTSTNRIRHLLVETDQNNSFHLPSTLSATMTPLHHGVAFLITMAAALTFTAAFSPIVQHTKSSISTRLNMATWSDSRAVREYQEFLASGRQDIEKRPDLPSAIVKTEGGDSEMADAIFKMGFGDDIFLLPGQDAPVQIGGFTSYPIYITIPPQQLLHFLQNLPVSLEERRDDLVFISGGPKYGNIEKVLKDTGFCRDAMTQMLATGFKAKPYIQDISVKLGTSANGEEKIAGECMACGKWSGSVEERLGRNNIVCKTVFYREWRRLMVRETIVIVPPYITQLLIPFFSGRETSTMRFSTL